MLSRRRSCGGGRVNRILHVARSHGGAVYEYEKTHLKVLHRDVVALVHGGRDAKGGNTPSDEFSICASVELRAWDGHRVVRVPLVLSMQHSTIVSALLAHGLGGGGDDTHMIDGASPTSPADEWDPCVPQSWEIDFLPWILTNVHVRRRRGVRSDGCHVR